MKSLGRTIDRILRVDPQLEDKLLRIKTKWERYPSKNMDYWKELLDFLNSDPFKKHPNFEKIREIIVSKRKQPQQLYTFEDVVPGEKVEGCIPENLADTIRAHDRRTVRLAKLQIEANMTRNTALHAKLSREELLMEINKDKIWLQLKDHFNLWGKTFNYSIRRQTGTLVLVEQPPTATIPPMSGVYPMKMDQNALRELLRRLGMDPNNQNPQFPENDM
jgi:hypothetical protein